MTDLKETKKTNTVFSPPARMSFVNAFKPRAPFEGQEPKYSVQLLIPTKNVGPKAAEAMKAMKAAVSKEIRKKWGEDKTEWPKNLTLPFKDGNEKNMDQYKDMIMIEARSKQKPGIVDKEGNEITDAQDFYSGCWGRATLSAFAWSKMGKNGVSFGLQNLQKLKDDKAFSGKKHAKDDFDSADELDDDFKTDSSGSNDSDLEDNDF